MRSGSGIRDSVQRCGDAGEVDRACERAKFFAMAFCASKICLNAPGSAKER
jgi:hypothetical protein